ncbi:MAG: radical SAM protein, partial [archaeon]
KNLSNIPGIAYRKMNSIIKTEKRELSKLVNLPLPDYSLLPLRKYYYELMGQNFMLFELSRGCPFKCNYCNQIMFDYKYRVKPNIYKELETAVEKFNIQNGYFIDLEFTVNRKNVEEVCDFLINKKYKFKWCCQTRADSIDIGLLRKMKKAGCTLIHFGVETGSPRIMKMINKRITLEKIEEGIKLTRKVGIDSACFFMIGFPTETDEEIRMTIDFSKKINPTYASFHTVSLYPGTKLFETLNQKIQFPISEAYTKERKLTEQKAITRRAFIEFYVRPRYILSRLRHLNLESYMKQLKLFIRFVS